MVEEASGTRMFEDRKDKAKKTMGKKEKRVEQITSLLTEEITPKLDTLRAEKRSFLQWQKACSELERIGRVLRAWEWTEGNAKVQKKEAEVAIKEKEIEKLDREKDRLSKEIAAAEAQHEDVTAQRDKELKKGGKFKKLEDDVAEKGKELVKLRTQLEIKNGTVVDEEEKVGALRSEMGNVSRLSPEQWASYAVENSSKRPSRTNARKSESWTWFVPRLKMNILYYNLFCQMLRNFYKLC
jgi:structural maintenance of chromosome 2